MLETFNVSRGLRTNDQNHKLPRMMPSNEPTDACNTECSERSTLEIGTGNSRSIELDMINALFPRGGSSSILTKESSSTIVNQPMDNAECPEGIPYE